MKTINIKIYFVIFLIPILANGQSSVVQRELADSLFLSENYFDAITEYKRLDFFSDTPNDDFYIYSQIGFCYKYGGKYNDAIKYFRMALINSETREDSIKSTFQIIRTNILRRTTSEAIAMLNNVEEIFPNSTDSADIHYWKGWAYMMKEDWENASLEFGKISKTHLLKILSDSTESQMYSVSLAKALSFIIPGSGQFYSGNYLSGIMSLGWNVLWGYLTIHAFVTDRAVEGIFIGGLLWARFYRGNFQNAEKFAIAENKEISNKAFLFLDKKYKGKKP